MEIFIPLMSFCYYTILLYSGTMTDKLYDFSMGHFHHHDEVTPSLSQQQQNCDIFISEFMDLLILYTSFLV